jgi:hypothetical protein
MDLGCSKCTGGSVDLFLAAPRPGGLAGARATTLKNSCCRCSSSSCVCVCVCGEVPRGQANLEALCFQKVFNGVFDTPSLRNTPKCDKTKEIK